MAFQSLSSDSAENIGYVIPTVVIMLLAGEDSGRVLIVLLVRKVLREGSENLSAFGWAGVVGRARTGIWELNGIVCSKPAGRSTFSGPNAQNGKPLQGESKGQGRGLIQKEQNGRLRDSHRAGALPIKQPFVERGNEEIVRPRTLKWSNRSFLPGLKQLLCMIVSVCTVHEFDST